MSLNFFKRGALTLLAAGLFVACQQSDLGVNNNEGLQSQDVTVDPESALIKPADVAKMGFVHAIMLNVDGEDYYLAGAPDGPNGATDIPGHYWKVTGKNRLLGKHFNTGPFGKPQWWSSDAQDGSLLFIVNAIIDTWSMKKAKRYAKAGFVHYHEMVSVADGSLHPNKVLWLQHIAVRGFTLDGGPHPELAHSVRPGIDFNFIANGMMPYNP